MGMGSVPLKSVVEDFQFGKYVICGISYNFRVIQRGAQHVIYSTEYDNIETTFHTVYWELTTPEIP